jgi:hypothetical protein
MKSARDPIGRPCNMRYGIVTNILITMAFGINRAESDLEL